MSVWKVEKHVRSVSSVFREKMEPQEIMQKCFSDGQDKNKISEASQTKHMLKIGPSGNHAKIIFRWSGQKQISEVVLIVFFETCPPENHENTSFRAFLED